MKHLLVAAALTLVAAPAMADKPAICKSTYKQLQSKRALGFARTLIGQKCKVLQESWGWAGALTSYTSPLCVAAWNALGSKGAVALAKKFVDPANRCTAHIAEFHTWECGGAIKRVTDKGRWSTLAGWSRARAAS